MKAAVRAIADAQQGDFRAADALSAAPSDGAATVATALAVERWLADLDCELPSVEPLADAAGPWRPLAAQTCARLAMAHALQFDADAVARVAAVHAGLGGDGDLLGGWLALAQGEGEARAAEALVEVERRALTDQDPGRVIEAASLRALMLLASGDDAEALEVARRASRMARTEALPQSEYLANVVLARCRRAVGTPHLATRILVALRSFASRPWHRWIDWERALAGEDLQVDGLTTLLEAAAGGDRAGFERAKAACGSDWAMLATDVAVVCDGLDPSVHVDRVASAIAPWCRGDTAAVPAGLGGLVIDEEAAVHVVAHADGAARRIISTGRALAEPSAVTLQKTRRQHGREDTLLAVLALAGPEGAPEGDVFRSVYGFAFAKNSHREVFTLLLHRTRKRLEAHGTIERQDDRLRMVVTTTLVVADPRCRPAWDLRVLQFLARHGNTTARDLSGTLGIRCGARRRRFRAWRSRERASRRSKGARCSTGWTTPRSGSRPVFAETWVRLSGVFALGALHAGGKRFLELPGVGG